MQFRKHKKGLLVAFFASLAVAGCGGPTDLMKNGEYMYTHPTPGDCDQNARVEKNMRGNELNIYTCVPTPEPTANPSP